MNSTKQPPSATGGRLTRLVQTLTLLAAVKLAAICLLWLPPTLPQSPLLQPVVIRPAMAASQALAAESTPPAAPKAAQDNASQEASNASESEPNAQTETQDLNTRQQDLDKREADLRTLELELDAKLKNLRELELKMQTLIDSASNIRDERMQHLIDVYSNMKPKQAAQVLGTLEESIAVRILAGMSGRKAGEILSSVQPNRAAKLSEALTRLQTSETGK